MAASQANILAVLAVPPRYCLQLSPDLGALDGGLRLFLSDADLSTRALTPGDRAVADSEFVRILIGGGSPRILSVALHGDCAPRLHLNVFLGYEPSPAWIGLSLLPSGQQSGKLFNAYRFKPPASVTTFIPPAVNNNFRACRRGPLPPCSDLALASAPGPKLPSPSAAGNFVGLIMESAGNAVITRSGSDRL